MDELAKFDSLNATGLITTKSFVLVPLLINLTYLKAGRLKECCKHEGDARTLPVLA